MMRRALGFFMLWIGTGFLGAAGQTVPLIMDVSLVEDQRFEENRPPMELTLGVEMREAAPFKLMLEDEVLEAGRLEKGFNFLSFKCSGFFMRSEIRHLVLDVRHAGRSRRKRIELDIHLSKEIEDLPKVIDFTELDYELSLFIKDRKLASSRMSHYQKFPIQVELPRLPLDHRPYDPDWKTDPMANSFSVFSAVAMAIQAFKEVKRMTARDAYRYEYRTKKVIVSQFLRREAGGEETPVPYVIRLTTQDDESSEPSPRGAQRRSEVITRARRARGDLETTSLLSL